MRFILLGAGRIAEKLASDSRFSRILEKKLAGTIATDSVNRGLEQTLGFSRSIPTFSIKDKLSTEKDIKLLVDSLRPDYLISIQYPWVLSASVLTSMSGRVINLHNAKLPDYRGHNSLSHEILNGETLHTSTLHFVDEEVDRGRIIKVRKVPIKSDDTAYSLWRRSVVSSLILLEEWFAGDSGSLNPKEGAPVGLGGAYYPKDISTQKQIPDGATSEAIDKWARAFWFPPHEPAFIKVGARKLYVLPTTYEYRVD